MDTQRSYRDTLSRFVQKGDGKTVLFVMLNPSTAGEDVDDATIRKCKKFIRRWGHSAFIVVNLWTMRATKPADLYSATPAERRACTATILREALTADLVIAAWGAFHIATVSPTWGRPKAGATRQLSRGDFVKYMLKTYCGDKLYCLGENSNGSPKHPLYLPDDTTPRLWV